VAGRSRRLRTGEEVIFEVHPHWTRLLRPVLVALAAVAGGIAARVESLPRFAQLMVAAALGCCLLWLLARYAVWMATSLVLTTDRLVLRRGVFVRSSREILLLHIAELTCRRRFRDRMVGAGDLVIETAGGQHREVVVALPHPDRLQSEITSQIDRRSRERDPLGTFAIWPGGVASERP
jgi:uncharacterized membrane protein YdbT with pleckstrin-like domain